MIKPAFPYIKYRRGSSGISPGTSAPSSKNCEQFRSILSSTVEIGSLLSSRLPLWKYMDQARRVRPEMTRPLVKAVRNLIMEKLFPLIAPWQCQICRQLTDRFCCRIMSERSHDARFSLWLI